MRILIAICLFGYVVGFPPTLNLSSFRNWINSIVYRSGQSLADVLRNGFMRYEDMIIQKGSDGIVSLEMRTRLNRVSKEIQEQAVEQISNPEKKKMRLIPAGFRQVWQNELYQGLYNLGLHPNFITTLTEDLNLLCQSYRVRCGGYTGTQIALMAIPQSSDQFKETVSPTLLTKASIFSQLATLTSVRAKQHGTGNQLYQVTNSILHLKRMGSACLFEGICRAEPIEIKRVYHGPSDSELRRKARKPIKKIKKKPRKTVQVGSSDLRSAYDQILRKRRWRCTFDSEDYTITFDTAIKAMMDKSRGSFTTKMIRSFYGLEDHLLPRNCRGKKLEHTSVRPVEKGGPNVFRVFYTLSSQNERIFCGLWQHPDKKGKIVGLVKSHYIPCNPL